MDYIPYEYYIRGQNITSSYHLRQLYSSVPLFCSIPFLLLWNCCTILALPISSEIIDRFWHSRCLNDHINLFYIIGSFASGTNVSLVAKNGTKKIIPLLRIKPSKNPQIKKFIKKTPQKREFWFKIQFRNFLKPKIKLKKIP